MTPRVWIERPIESVEDAEALPEGTVVLTRDLSRPYAWTKDDLGDFRDHYCSVMWPQDIAGDDVIALVPVEAVEDRAEMWRTVSDLFAAMQTALSGGGRSTVQAETHTPTD